MLKKAESEKKMNFRQTFYKNVLILRQAIRKKKMNIVRHMIAENPKLSHSSALKKDVDSPMWLAMSLGLEDVVQVLVDSGASVNEWFVVYETNNRSHDKKTVTFFHWLAMLNDISKHTKIAQLLLEFGADLNMKNAEIATPLEVAVSRANVDCVEFLLKNGARLRDSEYMLQLIINLKMRHRRKTLVALIKNGLDTSYHNTVGENLLHMLSKFEKHDEDEVPIAQVLLDAGVPIDEPDKKNHSPLQQAIDRNHIKLAAFFIKKGADVNFKCDHGWTALHQACNKRDDKAISLLIRKGAKISAPDGFTRTPFGALNFYWLTDDVRTMVREFAKLSIENGSILEEDMNSIKNHEDCQKYFDDCKNELLLMKSAIFYYPFSCYSILKMTKNMKKLAKLLKNKEFEKKLEKSLNTFPRYKKDLRCIFDEAVKLKNETLTVYSRLRSVFGDTLHEDLLRKLGENLTIEDLPLH